MWSAFVRHNRHVWAYPICVVCLSTTQWARLEGTQFVCSALLRYNSHVLGYPICVECFSTAPSALFGGTQFVWSAIPRHNITHSQWGSLKKLSPIPRGGVWGPLSTWLAGSAAKARTGTSRLWPRCCMQTNIEHLTEFGLKDVTTRLHCKVSSCPLFVENTMIAAVCSHHIVKS